MTRRATERDAKLGNAEMRDITACVICGKRLAYPREHVDTCGPVCFRRLLRQQRGLAEPR